MFQRQVTGIHQAVQHNTAGSMHVSKAALPKCTLDTHHTHWHVAVSRCFKVKWATVKQQGNQDCQGLQSPVPGGADRIPPACQQPALQLHGVQHSCHPVVACTHPALAWQEPLPAAPVLSAVAPAKLGIKIQQQRVYVVPIKAIRQGKARQGKAMQGKANSKKAHGVRTGDTDTCLLFLH